MIFIHANVSDNTTSDCYDNMCYVPYDQVSQVHAYKAIDEIKLYAYEAFEKLKNMFKATPPLHNGQQPQGISIHIVRC